PQTSPFSPLSLHDALPIWMDSFGRRDERQRDLRHVAFLAAQARPERGLDDCFDRVGVGHRRDPLESAPPGIADMTFEMFPHERRDRAGRRVRLSLHRGTIVAFSYQLSAISYQTVGHGLQAAPLQSTHRTYFFPVVARASCDRERT